jgi:hypothetical protein
VGQKKSQNHADVMHGWSLIGVYPVLRSAYLKYFSSWQIAAPLLKVIYSEKATKFCEIFTLLLSYGVPVESEREDFAKFCGHLRIYELYMPIIVLKNITQTHCLKGLKINARIKT